MLVALEINAMRGHRISRMVSPVQPHFAHQFSLIRSVRSDGDHFSRPYLSI
jgi:hypothetical protein